MQKFILALALVGLLGLAGVYLFVASIDLFFKLLAL